VREFYMSYGNIPTSNVKNIMNMVKVFDLSTMAYYRFTQHTETYMLKDNFRNQKADYKMSLAPGATKKVRPKWMQEDISNMMCNTLSVFEEVARFENFKGEPVKFQPKEYKQIGFGYTVSMWIKNLGGLYFTKKEKIGREKHQFFRLDKVFALWYDSQQSFRVYMYTKSPQEEFQSESIFLPLN